jgi:CBS-domain-containing membrane protein
MKSKISINFQNMKVADIMTKEVITVSPETKVTEVARIIHEHNFNGLPVVDGEKKLLGLVTEMDLLANDSFGTHIPSFAKLISDFKVLKMVKGEDKKNLEAIVNASAASIMDKEYSFSNPETTLTELLALFNEKHANPIPVVDNKGTLQGIVARSDIVKLVSRFSEAELDFLRN